MQTKQKILVLASTFPRWPGDTDPPFVYHLCQGLGRYEVHVLAPHHAGSAEYEVMGGVHVHRYRYAPQRWEVLAYDGGILRKIKRTPVLSLLLPVFLICQWLAVWRLQRKHTFCLTHAHWIIPQGLVASFSTGKYLLTSHGGDLYALKGRLLSWLKRRVMHKAGHITVVSRAMVDECVRLGISAEKVSVCPMGVDTRERFVPPGSTAVRSGILYVGRLVEKKGVIYLLQGMCLLKKRGIEASLTVVGGGPDADALKRFASENGLDESVSFLGAIKNAELPGYYQSAQVFVLPSVVSGDGDQEGLGLVSVEAMACGCPVVASDLPAVRDVITNGADGLLVPPADPAALAEAIERLLVSPGVAEEIARAATDKAARFDWGNVCADYLQVIEKVINVTEH